jgi:hypothetical protein
MLVAAVIASFASCGSTSLRRVAATLDDVESFINDQPDSALSVLRSVDTTALRTRALLARYSLLRVMALDKCFEDITRPGLLDPAVAWYERHGSADEILKMFYYQGCIHYDNKELGAAAISYSQAENYVGKAKDMHAVALLYEAFATVYNQAFNTEREQEYIEKELSVLKESGDPMYGSVLGELALVFHTKKEWSEADSLYRLAISQSDDYPQALTSYLSNYARMKLLQPEKDPEGAISLLDRKREVSGRGFTPKEAGAYAYALALNGRTVDSKALQSRLEQIEGPLRYDVLPWLARLAVLEGDAQNAYAYQTEMHAEEEELILSTLNDPVSQALQDFSEHRVLREREKKLRLGLLSLGVIVLLLSLTIILFIRARRIQYDRDRLVAIRNQMEQNLREQEDHASKISADLSSRLEQLRAQLRQERLDRFRKNGRYSYWLWQKENSRSSDTEVIRLLRKDLQEVCRLENNVKALARRLDEELDGLFSRLKSDLSLVEGTDDIRLLCYWLINLKPDMISELLGITTNNVYVREHRLEERIRRLGKEEYAFLVE